MQRFFHRLMTLSVAFIFSILTGCGTLQNGRGWGEDAMNPGNIKMIPRTFYNALKDPKTLIPAAGALAFYGGKLDKKVSRWANKHNPIYGSRINADDASDLLLIPLRVGFLLSAITTPSGDDIKNWVYWKIKGIGVEYATFLGAMKTTNILKDATNRTRPDQSDDKSFPSGHATEAYSLATLANRNFEHVSLPENIRITFQIANILLASGVAWARIEADKHYPSDVLAAAALSNFICNFMHDILLGLPMDNKPTFMMSPLKNGWVVEFFIYF